MRGTTGWTSTMLLLAVCAAPSPNAPAPESCTAETTYAKLAPTYPLIRIAQRRFSLGREQMVEQLRALGVPNRVVPVPDTPHSFWLFDPWLAPTVEAMDAFLRAVIPPRTDPPGSPPAA